MPRRSPPFWRIGPGERGYAKDAACGRPGAPVTKEGPFYEANLSFGAVRYSIRRSARAKRLSLRFHERQGFEVVLPERAPLREVEPFLSSMEPWILRTISTRRRPPTPPFPTGLSDEAQLPFMGNMLTLRIGWAEGGASTIQFDDLTVTAVK